MHLFVKHTLIPCLPLLVLLLFVLLMLNSCSICQLLEQGQLLGNCHKHKALHVLASGLHYVVCSACCACHLTMCQVTCPCKVDYGWMYCCTDTCQGGLVSCLHLALRCPTACRFKEAAWSDAPAAAGWQPGHLTDKSAGAEMIQPAVRRLSLRTVNVLGCSDACYWCI